MTTPEAAHQYESEHIHKHKDRAIAIFNPQHKPVNELPVIYGFNDGGKKDWLYAVLLAEDGTFLGSHICSSEAYIPADLGILEGTRPDRHEQFREHYPNGYRMEFVGYNNVLAHVELNKAINLNTLNHKE